MTIIGLGQGMCENRNAELLLKETYRINPHTKFNIIGDIISEKEALMLYYAVLKRDKNDRREGMVYIPMFNLKS